MNNVIHTAPQATVPTIYKAAAASVIALSIAGIGAMTGYLPTKKAEGVQSVALAAPAPAAALPLPQSAAPAASAATPAVVQAQANNPAPAASVTDSAVKPRVAKVTPRRVDTPTASASPVANHPVAVSAAGNYPTPYPAYPSAGGATVPVSGQTPYPVYPQTGDDYPGYPKVVQAQAPTQAPARPVCNACGTVESIRTVEKPGEGSGVGVAGGALGGGVLGRQFGNGRGRDALTILGAIGGGIVGNQIEKSVRTVKAYEVVVRMEDGSLRTVSSATQPSWRTGERVKVDGNNIILDYS